ncbi:serine/threonine-protein kinase [Sphingomonas sp. 1P06PA]|uniref:serine/threonine-protein kinase n=1 Tax=Sphingomonas sp. 1P06PA TaxID=554121 RepID=UPI0039A535AE
MTGDDRQPPEDGDRTVFLPSGGVPPSAPPPPPAQQPTMVPGNMTYVPMAPRTDGDRIQVGDVLNHIFRVDRFIARGGMGEVFEGINVSSDERVAIKVMLPALAADPNVQAMFRKEARTLTRLSHPALVQYRVLAQEPQLGVLYIVTEYIDGKNLADVLGSIDATPQDLAALTRRLADGLRVAHGLGAIHRDISPDNVLLEDGRLDKAKIIDFGIAKDLDPGSKTIVGDGFAGKLNYVAPEQLGDFGRDVGPWSDVYSLGLVILAVAIGRNVDMGATLVDAVDKRRAGPDLSAIPDPLRPVLAQMLAANPADRLRSMDDVVAALDGIGRPATAFVREPGPVTKGDGAGGGKGKTGLLVGGGIAVALALAIGGYTMLGGGGDTPAAGGESKAGSGTTTVAAPAGSPVEAARAAINTALPAIGCTWLDISDIRQSGDGVGVAMTGVASAPGKAQAAISSALADKGISAKDINFDEVASVPASTCTALDALRSIRKPDATGLSVEQTKWEMAFNSDPQWNKVVAQVILNLDLGSPGAGAAVFGLQETGAIENIAEGGQPTRQALEAIVAAQPGMTKTGANSYRFPLTIDHKGWSGFLLLTGQEPFDAALITTPPAQRGGDWKGRFLAEAKAKGWQSEMVWFKTVDDIPES